MKIRKIFTLILFLIIIFNFSFNLYIFKSAAIPTIDTPLSNSDASFIGENIGDSSAHCVANAGDVNGDGFNDLLIGAVNNCEGGGTSGVPFSGAGQTYLIFGKKSGWAKNINLSSADASFIGENPGDQSGISVSLAGDVNNDGFDDILIGASYNNQIGTKSGKIYLIFGKATGWAQDHNLTKINTTFLGEIQDDFAGYSVSICGDINGDGFDDILIGADKNNENGLNTGQSYLILGKSSGWTNNTNLSISDASFWGENVNDCAGYIVSGAGDVNSDAFDDLLIGAENNDEGGNLAGQTYLIFPEHNTRPITITSLKLYKDNTFTTETSQVKNGNCIFIELIGTDGNSSQQNVAEVIVNSSNTDIKGFKVRLYETGLNTGIYRGNIRINWITHESHKWIGAKKGETVYVTSYKDPTKFDTVLILNGNPRLKPIQDNTKAIEDNFYNETYDFTDADGDPVSWQYNSNAAWLKWGVSNHTLFGTPNNADIGTYWVKINISDGDGGFDERNFSLKVENIPPNIITNDLITAYEDLQYKNDYNSTDDNQGIITWSLFTNSSWLNINKNSGVISGIPDNEDVGIYYVNVTVDDGNGGMDFSNFSINVFNTNDRPLIITPNNLTAIEDVYYDVDYEAEDVDIGDSLTWNIESNASWLFIDINTGILTGTPDNYEVGCYNINISCKDDSEAFDFTEFILTVININDFPVITTEDIITAYEDIYYENDYDAIEIDIGDSISWSLQTNASWLEIDSETGLVQGIPDNSDVGTYWVNVTCTDNNEGFDFHYFELTVINTNDVPILMPIEDITLTYEDQYYEQIYNYIDIDSDEVDWTFKTNATWLNWGKENHTLFGTPINNDVGSYWVRINITDNHGGFDEHYFNLNVINVNDAPFIDGAPMELEINALEDYELEFSEYVFDVDNSLKDLELIIDTDHAIVNGLNIIFNYPNSINSELITIAATDGLAFSNEHHIEIAVILKDLTFPDVLDKEPTGDGVPITTNITITFSEEMDFETVVDSFEVSPIVYGKFIQNNTIIIFNPISDFDYNTEYWVTIDITATDLAGNPLQKVIEWNFTTEKPTIDTDNDGFSDDIDAFPNDPRYHSDSDNDSMPDTWEDQYGLDKYNSIDASEDLDKDGKSNLNEFIDGTDPTVNGKTDADQKEEDSSGYIILAVIVIIITIVIIFLFLIKTGKIKLKLMGKREEE